MIHLAKNELNGIVHFLDPRSGRLGFARGVGAESLA